MIHKRKLRTENRGIGMTSQGTRDRLVQTLRNEGIKDERVLKVITQVPRHKFIDEALSSRAYENTALPIGQSQTISQPWIVARMTEALLDGGNPQKVLEVGTGSGYQAAVLAEKTDFAEELVRLNSHLGEFGAALDRGGEVSKKLTFLLQEIHREATTMGNKAADPGIIRDCLAIKEQVEKIREQVQNLE